MSFHSSNTHSAPMVVKLWMLEVGGQKMFWQSPTTYIFNVILYSKPIVLGRPEFDSRLAQILRVYNFAAPSPSRT